jgi:DNA-binding transcriptional regulator YhcF (GntR family)
MLDRIDPRSPIPLYAQIAGRLRSEIAAGDLPAGSPLPSVRQLAATLRVNPATVVQAYRDLETDGFVEMRQGAGTFVREVATERRARERTRLARQLVRSLVAEAARAGVPLADLAAALDQELGAKHT